jgi:hypothetical protein
MTSGVKEDGVLESVEIGSLGDGVAYEANPYASSVAKPMAFGAPTWTSSTWVG